MPAEKGYILYVYDAVPVALEMTAMHLWHTWALALTVVTNAYVCQLGHKKCIIHF